MNPQYKSERFNEDDFNKLITTTSWINYLENDNPMYHEITCGYNSIIFTRHRYHPYFNTITIKIIMLSESFIIIYNITNNTFRINNKIYNRNDFISKYPMIFKQQIATMIIDKKTKRNSIDFEIQKLETYI